MYSYFLEKALYLFLLNYNLLLQKITSFEVGTYKFRQNLGYYEVKVLLIQYLTVKMKI